MGRKIHKLLTLGLLRTTLNERRTFTSAVELKAEYLQKNLHKFFLNQINKIESKKILLLFKKLIIYMTDLRADC